MTTEINKIKTDSYDSAERVIVPPVDIHETENEFIIKADMPGVDKGDVEITLENGTLTINGRVKNEETGNDLKYREFNLYNFYRSFNVGREINGDAIKATMENGVLVLALPKKEELKPRKIEVTTH